MKERLLSAVLILFIAFLVNGFAPEEPTSGITQFLYNISDEQEEFSNDLTEAAVRPVEGTIVGAHKVDGSNWSIPNILRNIVGGR